MTKKLQRTGFMTEIDQFLREFDKKRTTLPAARVKEVKKHEKIFAKRDGVVEEEAPIIWKNF